MDRSTAPAGFALPMAILLLMVTTGAVLTALSQASTERRMLDSELGMVEALVLAETALERFVTEGKHWEWQGSGGEFPQLDSGHVRLHGLGAELGLEGYADVFVQRLWAGGDSAFYVIRARGVRTVGGWAGAPAAVQTVTRNGKWKTATLDVQSAWTSIGGLVKNGTAGSLDGNDACGQKAAKAGVAVPVDPGYFGPTGPVTGDPPILHIGDDVPAAADAVNIDWETILNGGITPDYVIPGVDWSDIDFSEWPVVLVTEPDFTLPVSGGRGILIVTGDLNSSGSDLWQGVVLVGGKLTSNGNNTVSGATISGLNAQLGVSVPPSDVGNGTKTFQYNSCHVASAMQAYGGSLNVLENTWLDNWLVY